MRVSVVLLHADPDGVDRPVTHFSKRFNWPEANYSTFEMETLPLLLALLHFELLCPWSFLLFPDFSLLLMLTGLLSTYKGTKAMGLFD